MGVGKAEGSGTLVLRDWAGYCLRLSLEAEGARLARILPALARALGLLVLGLASWVVLVQRAATGVVVHDLVIGLALAWTGVTALSRAGTELLAQGPGQVCATLLGWPVRLLKPLQWRLSLTPAGRLTLVAKGAGPGARARRLALGRLLSVSCQGRSLVLVGQRARIRVTPPDPGLDLEPIAARLAAASRPGLPAGPAEPGPDEAPASGDEVFPPLVAAPAPGACCGVCGSDEVQPDLEWVDCPGCRTQHHAACWSYLGGCPILGCERRADEAPRPSECLGGAAS